MTRQDQSVCGAFYNGDVIVGVVILVVRFPLQEINLIKVTS